MVTIEEITKAEFLQKYAEDLIQDVIYVKDRVYGKSPEGMADEPEPYKVVWAIV